MPRSSVLYGGNASVFRSDKFRRGSRLSCTMTGSQSDHDAVTRMLACDTRPEEEVVKPPETQLQRRVARVVNGQVMQVAMGLIVLFSCVLIMIQTDEKARGQNPKRWEMISGHVLLTLFVLEIVGRLVAERTVFFLAFYNNAELVIVAADVSVFVVQFWRDPYGDERWSFSFLRILRLVRLSRVVRLLSGFRELFMMLHGLHSATKAICWSMLLCAVWLIMWSIFAVEFIRPWAHELQDQGKFDQCRGCERAFDDLWSSCLTLIKTIICGDSWGELAIPMMEVYPLSSVFFLGSFMTINVGLMNLVVAVIVDRASEARSEDEVYTLEEKIKSFNNAKRKLRKICKDVDKDNDGHISWAEFKSGVLSSQEFAELLKLMDINMRDLAEVYLYCDVNHNGEVSYTQFIRQLYRLKTADSHTILVLLSEQVGRLYRKIEKEFPEPQTFAARNSAACIKSFASRLLSQCHALAEISDSVEEQSSLDSNSPTRRGCNAEGSVPRAPTLCGAENVHTEELKRSMDTDDSIASMASWDVTAQASFDSIAQQTCQALKYDLQKDVNKLVQRLESNVSSLIAHLQHGGMQNKDWVIPECKPSHSTLPVTIGSAGDDRDLRTNAIGRDQSDAVASIGEEEKRVLPWNWHRA